MADSSFDIVSKIDRQEIANAINSAAREVGTRYDFKNVGAVLEAAGDDGILTALADENSRTGDLKSPSCRARSTASTSRSRRASRRRSPRRSARSSARRRPRR